MASSRAKRPSCVDRWATWQRASKVKSWSRTAPATRSSRARGESWARRSWIISRTSEGSMASGEVASRIEVWGSNTQPLPAKKRGTRPPRPSSASSVALTKNGCPCVSAKSQVPKRSMFVLSCGACKDAEDDRSPIRSLCPARGSPSSPATDWAI